MYPETWRVSQASYERWVASRDQYLAQQPAVVDGPLISVVMPVYNTDLRFLTGAIESVRAQKYGNWQLCIADDASTEPAVVAELQRFAALDQRIRLICLENNAGIAGASNEAAALADGEFVALMDHDDKLHPEALNVVAGELLKAPQVKFLYTDSDHLDASGRRCHPFFKPGYDYSRFLGQNYLNHLTVIRRDLLQECQGWRLGYDGSQDYDLYLRVVERVNDREILHVPEVLYHWRDVPSSVARSNLGKAVQAARLAIRHHFERAGKEVEVKGCAHAIIYNRIEWPLPAGVVHVILYGEREADIEAARSALPDTGDRLSLKASSVTVPGDRRELVAALNDIGSGSDSDFICFLDARLQAVKPDWLLRLVAIAARPEVGMATGKLLLGDGRLACGPGYQARDGAAAASRTWLEREDSKGYIASLCLEQEVAVVPSALLVVASGLFRQLGGLSPGCDSLDAAVQEFCQRGSELGQRAIWSPHVQMRFSGDQEGGGSVRLADIASDYADTVPARLATNPNCAAVEWDVEWKEGGE